MSKILELLTYNYKKRKIDKGEVFSNHISSSNLDSETKEKLASTYIFNPIENIENVNDNLGEKHSPYTSVPSRARLMHIFPWLISFLAILLLLANIAYRGTINIKIEVLKKSAGQSAPVAESYTPVEHPATEVKNTDKVSTVALLASENHINDNIVKRLGFYGAALNKSRIIKDGILLVNDGTVGWASVGFDLSEPMDSTDRSIDFFVKGAEGNESLELILRDADSNSYLPQAHHIIFRGNMKNEWQFVSIPFNDFNGFYNPERVKHIGFEFGTQTTLNKQGTAIYIKNMRIVKNRDLFTAK